MPIIGYHRDDDSDLLALEADRKYLTHIVVDREMRIAKLSVRVDGLAPLGSGDGQPLIGVIYDSSGDLVAESEPAIVPINSELHWHDLRFDNVPGGALLVAGDYQFGVLVGGPESARIARVSGVGRRSSGMDIYGPVNTTTSEKVTLPQTSLKVASTTGFDSEGEIEVGGQTLRYTGKEATKFTGVTGGGGVVEAGSGVVQRGAAIKVNQPEAPMGDQRVNLVTNPDFFWENEAPWTLSSGGWTSATRKREASPAVFTALGSSFSMRVKGTHEASTTQRYLIIETDDGTGGFPVVAGTTYTVSGDIYATDIPTAVGGKNFYAEITWYDAEGEEIANESTGWNVAATTLTRISHSEEAPEDAVFARVRFTATSATSGDTVDFWLDNVMLEAAEEAGTYFPTAAQIEAGEIAWEGTAHASASSLLEGDFRLFATYFEEEEPPAIDDIQIGRYPFPEAQRVFGMDPPQNGTATVASCGWHGTLLSPERGSFCLVQQDGRFVDLVGERVRVSTFGGKSVNAYILGAVELEDDLSLTRRLFMELGVLSADSLNVRLEILSSEGTG